MAETLYLTPAGTPPLSPAQAPCKRKVLTTTELVEHETPQPKKAPRSRVPKTNQTKSRNGCHTCKAKRLKCDETKPTCQNCIRRKVECEGYKRDFKWKGFPDQNVGRRLTKTSVMTSAHSRTNSSTQNDEEHDSLLHQALEAFGGQDATAATLPLLSTKPTTMRTSDDERSQAADRASEAVSSDSSRDAFQDPKSVDTSTDVLIPDEHSHSNESVGLMILNGPHCRQDSFGQQSEADGGFIDVFEASQPSTTDEAVAPPTDTSQELWSLTNIDPSLALNAESAMAFSDQDMNQSTAINNSLFTSPHGMRLPGTHGPLTIPIQFEPTSTEALVYRFFNTTSSVMSIFSSTGGLTATTNPWQNLIWPLVKSEDSPMLFHAVISMACFHNYQSQPNLRLEGITHMRKSLEILHGKQQWQHVPIEVTLATCLTLTFAESWMCWKRNIKSGSSHIKTAKQCLMHALQQGAQTRMQKKQLRFLCKTYLYADVIARLTSVDDDVDNDAFDGIAVEVLGVGRERGARRSSTAAQAAELDPLMGSASTLFPIIGRVANLVRRVFRKLGSTLSHITEAQQLKAQLHSWSLPPSTATNEVSEYASLTAEAYRLATLVHLHQSVPELLISQRLSSYATDLGLRILKFIARIPPTSGTVTTHMYPLLVGGCEAKVEDDRQWVRDRFSAMDGRLRIGNVEKARDVVEGVWARRDEAELAKSCELSQTTSMSDAMSNVDQLPSMGLTDEFSFDDLFGSSLGSGVSLGEVECMSPEMSTMTSHSDSATGVASSGSNSEHELTINGSLHWVGVMKDWGWEVLLG